MKVLFVSSGNSKNGLSQIIINQGQSLAKLGINIEYFTIKGRGLIGYLKNVFPLKKKIRNNNYDIVHAHYAFSGFIATLAGSNPLIVSLMGSDVKSGLWFKVIIRLNIYFWWKSCIVKSSEMMENIGIRKVQIIPNGVNIDLFQPMEQTLAIRHLGWNSDKKHILFLANPNRPEKNFKLAQKSLKCLKDDAVEMHFLSDIPHDEMPFYYAASNVAILTSLWEGSPNVIKEALACCRPVVSTNVGDVEWLFGNTEGCYLCSFEAEDVGEKIELALNFSALNKLTNGRKRIIDLRLDSETIAQKVVSAYNLLLQ